MPVKFSGEETNKLFPEEVKSSVLVFFRFLIFAYLNLESVRKLSTYITSRRALFKTVRFMVNIVVERLNIDTCFVLKVQEAKSE